MFILLPALPEGRGNNFKPASLRLRQRRNQDRLGRRNLGRHRSRSVGGYRCCPSIRLIACGFERQRQRSALVVQHDEILHAVIAPHHECVCFLSLPQGQPLVRRAVEKDEPSNTALHHDATQFQRRLGRGRSIPRRGSDEWRVAQQIRNIFRRPGFQGKRPSDP